jgi:hypothetical protein
MTTGIGVSVAFCANGQIESIIKKTEKHIDQFIIGMQPLNTHIVYKSNIWRNRTLW